jgi:hypothetical protein
LTDFLKQYTILKQLASGGNKSVYQATHKEDSNARLLRRMLLFRNAWKELEHRPLKIYLLSLSAVFRHIEYRESAEREVGHLKWFLHE